MNIIKKVEDQVKKTLKEIKINKNEKILVALSGGKDSATVAYLLHKLGYKIEGFHIDLGLGDYSKRCLNAVEKLCFKLNIKLHKYDVKKEMGSSMCYLRNTIQSSSDGSGLKNCAICGVIKKWIMNKKARELKSVKIATGHNLDDEIQTFLINLFKGSFELSLTSGAITRNISDEKFIARVKPLFYVLENDVRNYAKELKLPVVFDKCPCALDSYRIQIRAFLESVSDKEKINLMNNFVKFQNKINKTKKIIREIIYCEICGEPSRKKLCKKCELMSMK